MFVISGPSPVNQSVSVVTRRNQSVPGSHLGHTLPCKFFSPKTTSEVKTTPFYQPNPPLMRLSDTRRPEDDCFQDALTKTPSSSSTSRTHHSAARGGAVAAGLKMGGQSKMGRNSGVTRVDTKVPRDFYFPGDGK